MLLAHTLLTMSDMPQLLRDTVAVGARVRALRESAGIEQSELADRAELSRAYVSRLENGGILNPKVYDLARIADVLNTTVSRLIEPPSHDTAPLRVALDELMEPGSAELAAEVVSQIGHWPAAEQQFALEFVLNQVRSWPRRTRHDS